MKTKFFFFFALLFAQILSAQENSYKNANYTSYINNPYISCQQSAVYDDIIFCDINFELSLVGDFTEKAFFTAIVNCDNYYSIVDKLGLVRPLTHNDIGVISFLGSNSASEELSFNIFVPRDAVKIGIDDIKCTFDRVFVNEKELK